MKNFFFISTFLASYFFCGNSIAYDAYEISNAAAMYLSSADLQKKLSTSQCAYAIKKSPPNLEARLQEVLSYLTPSDKVELEQFVRSDEFKMKMNKNQVIINDIYTSFLKDGYDNKTACGLLLGSLSQAISKGDLTWKNVNKSK
jgi:hypothetical protein